MRDHGTCSSLSLLELLRDLGGNSVHVGGSLLGQSLSEDGGGVVVVLDGDLANETGSLELDQAVPDALTSGVSLVLGASSVSLLSAVMLSEGVDSNLSSHVELVGAGGSSGVKPVIVVGSEVSGDRGLVIDGPLLILN